MLRKLGANKNLLKTNQKAKIIASSIINPFEETVQRSINANRRYSEDKACSVILPA